MKILALITNILFVFLLIFQVGCETTQPAPDLASRNQRVDRLPTYHSYLPTKVEILPLTEIGPDASDQAKAVIFTYLSLLDPFDSQIKAPCTLRFELYERATRSGEPKGRRVTIWPDIDLTKAADNNAYWQDYLRAYRFELALEAAPGQTYVLQATCISPHGKRISAEIILTY